MIELRWLESRIPIGKDAYGEMCFTKTTTKLQYRRQVHPDDAPACYDNGKAFSAWHDVPTVRE